jgi:hypothetical protein
MIGNHPQCLYVRSTEEEIDFREREADHNKMLHTETRSLVLPSKCISTKVLRPEPALRSPPFYSVSFSSVYRIIQTTDIGRKKVSSYSLAITRHTRNRDGDKSSGQTHLFNMGSVEAMDSTAGQAQVKLSLLSSIYFKDVTTGNVRKLGKVQAPGSFLNLATSSQCE